MMRYLLAWCLSSLVLAAAFASGWQETPEERKERVLHEVNEQY